MPPEVDYWKIYLNYDLSMHSTFPVGLQDKVFLATKLPSCLIKSREDMDRYLNEQL